MLLMQHAQKNPTGIVALASAVCLLGIGVFDPEHFLSSLTLYAVCIAQNTAFSLTSRSRNRDNQLYHALAAVGSNGVYLLTFKYMFDLGFEAWLFLPYIAGTVTGSLIGVKAAMHIERVFGITADGHLSR